MMDATEEAVYAENLQLSQLFKGCLHDLNTSQYHSLVYQQLPLI